MERVDTENTNSSNSSNQDDQMRRWERASRRGKVFGGMIVVAIGSLFLAKEMGMLIPHWIFSWKMLLIAIGLFVGVKHGFQRGGWLIPILIGSVFLLRDNFPELAISHYIWPIVIIFIGLLIMFKPRRRHCGNHRAYRKWNRHQHWQQKSEQWSAWQEKKNSDNYLEVNSVFSGIEKKIITKDFKGGEINVVFGGAEINLSQADFEGRIELEIHTIFGGTKLIIPPHWEVKSDVNAVMGSFEDKRNVVKDLNTPVKLLVIKGDVVFGGIDVQSF